MHVSIKYRANFFFPSHDTCELLTEGGLKPLLQRSVSKSHHYMLAVFFLSLISFEQLFSQFVSILRALVLLFKGKGSHINRGLTTDQAHFVSPRGLAISC